MAVMRAVLWDMDGTIVDSEKLWDIAIQEFYARHGRGIDPGGAGLDGGRFQRRRDADHLRRSRAGPRSGRHGGNRGLVA